MLYELKEVLGLVIIVVDSFWWYNDSGNNLSLFLSDWFGVLVMELVLLLCNKDWEDLIYDVDGNFYLGDFGDN